MAKKKKKVAAAPAAPGDYKVFLREGGKLIMRAGEAMEAKLCVMGDRVLRVEAM